MRLSLNSNSLNQWQKGLTPTHNTVCPNKKETHFQWDIFIAMQYLIKLYASLSWVFSLLSFDAKHLISQCMTEKEQFKLVHVKINLQIMVLS